MFMDPWQAPGVDHVALQARSGLQARGLRTPALYQKEIKCNSVNGPLQVCSGFGHFSRQKEGLFAFICFKSITDTPLCLALVCFLVCFFFASSRRLLRWSYNEHSCHKQK